MQELISLRDAAAAGPIALPPRKSAGLAWALSLILPGAGHFYLGLYLRAGLVFGFSLLGLVALVGALASGAQGIGSMAGASVVELPILWGFGFLDAYLTAVESNRGIDPRAIDNPRIAAVLNLTTTGFGYFYLGERGKGIALFVVLTVVRLLASSVSARAGAAISIALLAVIIWISVDAYLAGSRSFRSQVASMELPPPPPPSRLPVAVPLVLGGLTAAVLLLLLVAGSVMLLVAPGQS